MLHKAGALVRTLTFSGNDGGFAGGGTKYPRKIYCEFLVIIVVKPERSRVRLRTNVRCIAAWCASAPYSFLFFTTQIILRDCLGVNAWMRFSIGPRDSCIAESPITRKMPR